MNRLKILVVDDSVRHLQAATEQLGSDHDLVALESYEDAIKALEPGTEVQVLLSDLLMPAEPYCLGSQGLKFLGHEIPIGLVLALRAAQVGVQWIAVITDANHHNHPMSAALDWLGPQYWVSEVYRSLRINTSTVLISHAPLLADGRKDWARTLQALLSSSQ
jgi:CheY-like chemotaxis protein